MSGGIEEANRNKLKIVITSVLVMIMVSGCASFVSDDNDKPLIPKTKIAYYFYKNQFVKSENDTNLTDFEIKTMNFIVAVYDIDSKKLYFFEYDS